MSEEGTSDAVETTPQEDAAAEPDHPVSTDTTESNQEEHKETPEDKTTEPENTIDSNQPDHSDKTNGIDPALLQSYEPKSKVRSPVDCCSISVCTCILSWHHLLRFVC